MTHFLYQAAADAARNARRVFNRFYKKEVPQSGDGEVYEPSARVHIEFGYVRKTYVGKVEKQEFITDKHLNKALENHVITQLEPIAEQIVAEMEDKARIMVIASKDVVAAELARIEAMEREDASGPEVA